MKYKESKNRFEASFYAGVPMDEFRKWMKEAGDFAYAFKKITAREPKNEKRTLLTTEPCFLSRAIKGLEHLLKQPIPSDEITASLLMVHLMTSQSVWNNYIKAYFSFNPSGLVSVQSYPLALANMLTRRATIEQMISSGFTKNRITAEQLYNIEGIEKPKMQAGVKIVRIDLAQLRSHPRFPSSMPMSIAVQAFCAQVDAYKYAEDYHKKNAGRIVKKFLDMSEHPKTIKLELADLLLSLLIHTEEPSAYKYLVKHLCIEEETT